MKCNHFVLPTNTVGSDCSITVGFSHSFTKVKSGVCLYPFKSAQNEPIGTASHLNFKKKFILREGALTALPGTPPNDITPWKGKDIPLKEGVVQNRQNTNPT